MILEDLHKKDLIHPPTFLIDNTMYLCIMGSVAYGVSSDTSDMDLYGFCIPKKDYIFPHTAGYIHGFDEIPEFNQWQQHHIMDKDALGGKGREYDFSVYNISKYFKLLTQNNPNIVDSLFVPQNCIIHSTQIGQMLRDNRKIFLHKGCYHKFRGYAYSQKNKMETKSHKGLDALITFEESLEVPRTTTFEEVEKEYKERNSVDHLKHLKDTDLKQYYGDYKRVLKESKRAENVKIHGFDRKFAYHLIRLLDEVEQILTLGDLDLQRAKEHMKAIRKGEVSIKEIHEYFSVKEKQIEALYESSKIPYSPDKTKIKQLLIDCLEHHYGSLNKILHKLDKEGNLIMEIKQLIEKAGY